MSRIIGLKVVRILKRKQELAGIYDDRLERIQRLGKPYVPADFTHGYQTYCTLFKPDETLRVIGYLFDELNNIGNIL